jgi:hypothetical protein
MNKIENHEKNSVINKYIELFIINECYIDIYKIQKDPIIQFNFNFEFQFQLY